MRRWRPRLRQDTCISTGELVSPVTAGLHALPAGRGAASARPSLNHVQRWFLMVFRPRPSGSSSSQLQAAETCFRWDRGLPGGTPGTTTIIICTKLCTHRYISQVRSSQVLIFYVPGIVLQRVQSRQKLPNLYQVFPSVFGEDTHDPISCSPNLTSKRDDVSLISSIVDCAVRVSRSRAPQPLAYHISICHLVWP